jgi:phosphoribosylaminoimidazole-succinocarboxamide synthase
MLPLLYSGKVRDVFDAGGDLLVMIASDRISAFDRVFAEPVPDKGRVLTAMTVWWCAELADIAPNHLVSADPADLPAEARQIGDLAGRAMLVRRAEMLPIECIVRGYLAGSAWAEYRRQGTMHGERLPAGLRQADRLPEPVFTPSTKGDLSAADGGGHDVNLSFLAAAELVGRDVAERAREVCLAAYARAAERAASRGIVIADTKLELGVVGDELTICDEVITPDSSRFWPASGWEPGSSPPSFDKQPVRDWAEASGWDKDSLPPPLPESVVAATRARYVAAYEQVTGLHFGDWWGVGAP